MHLFRDAFRPFFPLAALLGAGVVGLWSLMLLGRIPVLPPAAHAQAMVWGAYGAAIQGFLLTAYPRQNDAAPPSPRAVVIWVSAHVGVWGLALAGWAGAPTTAAATALGAVTWGALTIWAARIAAPSLRRKWDGTTVAVPLTLAAATVSWVISRTVDPSLGLAAGLHLFLLPIALAVLDRVLPFFTSRVVPGYTGLRRPHFTVLLLLGGALHLVAPRVADLALAALLVWQWSGWRLHLRPPMIGVIHVGLAWMVAGYLLDALSPGKTALHLWTIGGVGTLLVALTMRVTLGHSGRAVELLPVGAAVLLGVQVATIGRQLDVPYALPAAAAVLSLSFLGWLLQYAPIAMRRG